MFPWSGLQTYNIIEFMPATIDGADVFNYFFTLMVVVGLFAFGIKVLVRIVSRS